MFISFFFDLTGRFSGRRLGCKTDSMGLLSLILVRIVATSSAFSYLYCSHQPRLQMSAMTNKNF
jgi:hypothetical protein